MEGAYHYLIKCSLRGTTVETRYWTRLVTSVIAGIPLMYFTQNVLCQSGTLVFWLFAFLMLCSWPAQHICLFQTLVPATPGQS